MEQEHEIGKVVQSLVERVALLERVVGGMAQQQGAVAPTPSVSHVQPSAPNVQPPQIAKVKTSNEIEFGQKWVSVVGVVLIFLATLFFVQFVFQYMDAAGKVLLSYLGAAILFGISFATKKKYPPFAGVVAAGAWAVTYLVTYAMYFFPATRLITSTPLEMMLLTGVVGALLLVSLHQRSKALVAMALVLGILTMVLSPLSLFSIIGTVLMLAVFSVIAVMMPWGDLVLPAAIGAYISYFFWFGNVLGRLPAQGGGFMEKQMLGLVVLVVMWIIIAVALLLRRDKDTSMGGQSDALTVILASGATAVLGLYALKELVLAVESARLSRATWLLLLSVLIGGWSVIAFEFKRKKDVVAAGGIIAMLLLMSSIAFFLPIRSGGTALAWAAMGLIVVVIGLFARNSWLAAISVLPLVASAVRFIGSDMQKKVAMLTPDLSMNIGLGLAISGVIITSAAFMRMLDLTGDDDKEVKKLPGVLLVVGLIVFYAIAAAEFTGALPSVLWSFAALATVAAGFMGHWKDARIVGLIGLALTVLRVFVYDLSQLDALPRVISFAILGGLLLLVGYGYNHNKEKLQKYLTEE